jgi:penicillin-binding protein 2
MTARLATGRAVQPRLVRSIDGKETPVAEAPELDVAEAALRKIRLGMFAVMNSQRGTAYSSRIAEETLVWAGKTGTSQVRNITAAERARGVISNDQLPWNRRDHALFVGFAPFENPRYAVSVVVEHGGGGSTAAAPIARDIMLRALHDDLPPLSAYPSSQRNRIESMFERLPLRDAEGRAPAASRA